MVTTFEVHMKTMAAAKCKTQFLSVIKDVQVKRETVLVSRNGKPVAKIVPLEIPADNGPLDAFYFGKIEILGDIMKPAYTNAELEEFENNLLAQFS